MGQISPVPALRTAGWTLLRSLTTGIGKNGIGEEKKKRTQLGVLGTALLVQFRFESVQYQSSPMLIQYPLLISHSVFKAELGHFFLFVTRWYRGPSHDCCANVVFQLAEIT